MAPARSGLTLLPAVVAAAALALAGCGSSPAERDAAAIVEKNAAARGGLRAWRQVKAMTLAGTLDAGRRRDPVKQALAYLPQNAGARPEVRRAAARRALASEEQQVQLPFVMELKRPRMSRVEVQFGGDTAVQVYDGTDGWKVRPFLGRREVEPFSAEELRVAAMQSDLDGPLLDAASKGSKVELVGSEPVDGREAWKLRVTARSGAVRHVWVDKETHLDVKVDGSRRMDGKPRPVFTVFRDYREVDGLLIPHLMETSVEGVPGTEKIRVESVTLNPRLEESRFKRTGLAGA